MKNILLATDFSVATAGAAGYAAWLAKLLGARLTVMSAYHVAPVFAGSSISESTEDKLPELVHCRLEETATRLSMENRIAVDVFARTGDPARAILTAARDIGADLIVVGKTGAGHSGKPGAAPAGLRGRARVAIPPFGATVVALARKTTIPLLVIPQAAECIRPTAIALAKELFNDDIPGALRELLGFFGCRLYLFGVKAQAPVKIAEIYRADGIHSATELFHLLYEMPVDSSLRHAMENFIEVAPIHWLVVRPLAGLAPERWVFGGQGKELVFDIRVPLLVLPETEKATARRGRSSSH